MTNHLETLKNNMKHIEHFATRFGEDIVNALLDELDNDLSKVVDMLTNTLIAGNFIIYDNVEDLESLGRAIVKKYMDDNAHTDMDESVLQALDYVNYASFARDKVSSDFGLHYFKKYNVAIQFTKKKESFNLNSK